MHSSAECGEMPGLLRVKARHLFGLVHSCCLICLTDTPVLSSQDV